MRSLSEMERCVECIANSRRVRVQTKEKELEENGGKRWNDYCTEGINQGSEGRHILLAHRLCRRRLHFERVYRRAVLPYTEVQMRTGAPAGRPDISYHIPLVHHSTGTYSGSEP